MFCLHFCYVHKRLMVAKSAAQAVAVTEMLSFSPEYSWRSLLTSSCSPEFLLEFVFAERVRFAFWVTGGRIMVFLRGFEGPGMSANYFSRPVTLPLQAMVMSPASERCFCVVIRRLEERRHSLSPALLPVPAQSSDQEGFREKKVWDINVPNLEDGSSSIGIGSTLEPWNRPNFLFSAGFLIFCALLTPEAMQRGGLGFPGS
nr:hypothetical protein Iba_chr13bCG1370 [Ipomoea batatas]